MSCVKGKGQQVFLCNIQLLTKMTFGKHDIYTNSKFYQMTAAVYFFPKMSFPKISSLKTGLKWFIDMAAKRFSRIFTNFPEYLGTFIFWHTYVSSWTYATFIFTRSNSNRMLLIIWVTIHHYKLLRWSRFLRWSGFPCTELFYIR